jgi:hypothetical protein
MVSISKETFKQIFRDHWPFFKKRHRRYDTPYYETIIQKMLDCGDPETMGYMQYRCTRCGEIRRIAFTCKSCFCLSCAKGYTDRWVDFIGRRLFPGVTYRHIVLTVPESLHRFFYRNPALLSPFMQVGHACLQEVFSRCAGGALDIGTIVVLQTAGRSGRYNPHLHCLVTGGGLIPQETWKDISYIPFELIHRKWQYHLLTMLRHHLSGADSTQAIDRAWKRYPKGFVAFVEKGSVPAAPQGLAKYLAKYLVSPPISVHRIQAYDGQTVRYWYRDHRSGRIQRETLPADLFIGRMVQHILPQGFQRIRYYGLHAHVRYATVRKFLHTRRPTDTSPDPRGFRILPRKPFADLFQESFGKNPLLCPRCNEPMTLESICFSDGTIKDFPLGQPLETPHESIDPAPQRVSRRGALDRTQRVVSLSLPFL